MLSKFEFRHSLQFFAVMILLTTAFAFPGAAAGECEAFPKVKWWGGLSHDKVVRIVDKKYKGDWAPYLVRLEKRLSLVQKAYYRGKGVWVKKNGVKVKLLTGDELKAYADRMRERIRVSYCLALRSLEGTESSHPRLQIGASERR
jgi:hypothetical protein